MRDDLHRGAPVPSYWRTVIKRYASDAEWMTEGPRAFHRALAQDANALLSDQAVRRLNEVVAASSAPLPGISPDLWFGGPLSAIERNAARSVMRELARGTANAETVCHAVSIALAEHARDVGRQISAHIHSEARGSHAQFMKRFRTSDSSEIIARAAQSRAAGERAAIPRPRQRIGIDSSIEA